MLAQESKNKLIKFVALIILISVAISLSLKMDKRINTLKIAYSYFEEINKLDPANVTDIYQANLLENLYVRLLEYDNDGNLVCNLCSSFEVNEKSLYFKIRKDLMTVDNHSVGADDVARSFRRLIRSRSNTHGELGMFIEDESSIYSENGYLVIKMKKLNYSQFILPILTSMDYSIIPSVSLDENEKIVDYRNTSGPYFIKSESENWIFLSANPNSINYSTEMPQEIKVIKVANQNAIDMFKKSEVDVIDVTMYPRSSTYKNLFADKSISFKSFKTLPMNLLYLGISLRAREAFSKDELFSACKIIKEKYKEFDTFGYGHTDAYQFFQGSGNGQLEDSELKELIELREKNYTHGTPKKIKLGVLSRSFEKVREAFEDQSFIEIVSYDNDPAFLDQNKQPDIFIQTTDSSFTEDINVISYNLNSGNFGLSKKQSEEWFSRYLDQDNKENRILMIKNLQKEILSKPVLCPVVISPYWAISRNDLDLNFPTHFPGSHWWKIRRL